MEICIQQILRLHPQPNFPQETKPENPISSPNKNSDFALDLM